MDRLYLVGSDLAFAEHVKEVAYYQGKIIKILVNPNIAAQKVFEYRNRKLIEVNLKEHQF